MAMDPVPYAIGGGLAKHSPEIARVLAYASTSGAEGIVTPGDLKVTATSVPGTSVAVAPGAALMLSRSPGGEQQTYVLRHPTTSTVAIAATGSSAGRTDLIVARVEDPYAAGSPWQVPADPTRGPYVSLRVISGVKATDTAMPPGQTGVVLARVTLPASTGTVTNAMVTDLRNLALPRSSSGLVSAGLGDELLPGPNNNTFRRWPTGFMPEVLVPYWATHASLAYTITGAATNSPSVDGAIRLLFANLTAGQATIDLTGSAAGMRYVLLATCSGPITTYLGQRAQVVLEGKLSNGALGVNTGAQALVQWHFEERAV